nr:mandelate racemase/muconate lactonizing enzyme family protein [Flexivirga oryzae]
MFVSVTTDTGIVGLGESGVWGFLEASAEVIRKFGDYLIGKDPLKIEHHWQYLYRATHFKGAVIMGALSAIDIALWDIAGKHHGVPVHALLGGAVRDRVRAYHHTFGSTRADIVEAIKAAKDAGFTAVGHLTPFLDESRDVPYSATHVHKISDAIDAVGQYRDAVGHDVDLCIEIHRRLTPAEAVELGNGIAQFRPLFYEDPVMMDNIDDMAYVANKIDIPIATGERYTSLWDFAMLLRRDGAQYFRPDVCLVGGITGAKKIAALAEAHHIGIVPHNPLGPISTIACTHLAAAIPNFTIQEYPSSTWSSFVNRPSESALINGSAEHDGHGYLVVPQEPGLGVSLKESAAEEWPYRPRPVDARLHVDGSVVDQ